jgi:outer membrane protein OmpA-like peptidoglycan-associated protein
MKLDSTVLAAIALFALACAGPMGPPGMTGAQGPTGLTGSQGQPGLAASPDASAGWISMRDVMFDFDTANIRASEMTKIFGVAAYVRQNPSVRIGVDGTTDLLRGANQYNEALSARRIANVRDALIRAGVSADRIETGRFGVERVACNESREECSMREGRVEVMTSQTRMFAERPADQPPHGHPEALESRLEKSESRCFQQRLEVT